MSFLCCKGPPSLIPTLGHPRLSEDRTAVAPHSSPHSVHAVLKTTVHRTTSAHLPARRFSTVHARTLLAPCFALVWARLIRSTRRRRFRPTSRGGEAYFRTHGGGPGRQSGPPGITHGGGPGTHDGGRNALRGAGLQGMFTRPNLGMIAGLVTLTRRASAATVELPAWPAAWAVFPGVAVSTNSTGMPSAIARQIGCGFFALSRCLRLIPSLAPFRL